MQRLAFTFVLLLPILCTKAKSSDTFELPRKNERIPIIHYDITAPSLESGRLAAERLEHLFNVWNLLFAEFIKESDNKSLPHRHRVVLYRNEQEYKDNLKRIAPLTPPTNGFYFAPSKTAYFSSTEEKILFHEGTHQILAERFSREPTFRNNFWIIEGIALFMQTLKVEKECYKIGDILADRLYSAKKYRFEWNYNLPIQKLTAMSAADIQSNVDMNKIYSQSAALVHWLMFAEEGRYRKHVFELLRRTYLDTATPDTLSELTGLSYEELDKRYEEFLKTIPDEK